MRSGFHVVNMPALATKPGMEAATRVGVRNGLEEIGRLTTSSIRTRLETSVDSRGFRGREDRGLLSNAVTPQAPVIGPTSARQTTTVVGPRADVAPVVEEGRRPNRRPPPPSEIARWLRITTKGQKLLARFQEERRQDGLKRISANRAAKMLSFRVARSIGSKGTPGIHMFRETQKEFAKGKSAGILIKHLQLAYGGAR